MSAEFIIHRRSIIHTYYLYPPSILFFIFSLLFLLLLGFFMTIPACNLNLTIFSEKWIFAVFQKLKGRYRAGAADACFKLVSETDMYFRVTELVDFLCKLQYFADFLNCLKILSGTGYYSI